MASEQADNLSAGNQLWIQFFEGKKDLAVWLLGAGTEVWEKLRGKGNRLLRIGEDVSGRLSILYKEKGAWDKALECYQDSLKILERAGDENGRSPS